MLGVVLKKGDFVLLGLVLLVFSSPGVLKAI